MVKAAEMLRMASIELSVTVLMGLGGAGSWKRNAKLTAQVLNQMSPPETRLHHLILHRHSPLYELVQSGEFKEASRCEILKEMREKWDINYLIILGAQRIPSDIACEGGYGLPIYVLLLTISSEIICFGDPCLSVAPSRALLIHPALRPSSGVTDMILREKWSIAIQICVGHIPQYNTSVVSIDQTWLGYQAGIDLASIFSCIFVEATGHPPGFRGLGLLRILRTVEAEMKMFSNAS